MQRFSRYGSELCRLGLEAMEHGILPLEVDLSLQTWPLPDVDHWDPPWDRKFQGLLSLAHQDVTRLCRPLAVTFDSCELFISRCDSGFRRAMWKIRLLELVMRHSLFRV